MEFSKAVNRWPVYIVMILIFLAFIYFALKNYQAINRELTRSAIVGRLSTAQLAASTLTEKLERFLDVGIALATRVKFRELIVAGKWQEAGEIMKGVPDDFPYIRRIFLTDIYGTEMYDIPHLAGGVGKNFSFRDWYKGTSENWQPYISRIYKRTAVPRRNVFAISIPVKYAQEGVIGILVLQIDLEEFFSWTETIDIDPAGKMYIVDHRGQLAYHPDYPAQGSIIDYSAVPAVRNILDGKTGVETLFNPVEKEEDIAAYEAIKFGWGVVIEQPSKVAFADRDRQLSLVLSGYGIILFFSIIVVLLLMNIARQRRREIEDRRLRIKLEKRVRERTEQLQATNEELESFSYSVSHDLRSPLRAVEGFSLILEEDYGDRLDDEGKRVLSIVRVNAKKMNELIEELLTFSRLGRQSLQPAKIDMQQLVNSVYQETGSQRDTSQISFNIGELPDARGDYALLKQVWSNLLSNAVKYSSQNREPRINVNGHIEGGEIVYSVKDNGAGFDMEYYDKLFVVFQRLHKPEDFPGTGVGLAIVHRIITRHGGRVWAEGKVGEGATFYFTLPGEDDDV